MRPSPVVVVLPLGQPQFHVRCSRISHSPEFFAVGFLRAFDFAIQMRRGRSIGAEFDAVVHEPLLSGHREEFATAIRLDPLHRKRHFFDDRVQEDQRAGRSASREHG